jgi:hypothetical protein
VYLLKYLCKGAGSTMTAADEKYDDDVEMLDVTEQVFCGFSIPWYHGSVRCETRNG